MNNIGLIQKFPVNRLLNEREIAHRLFVDKPSPSKPWYQISVIRMNSTYLECVDKFFQNKGMLSTGSITAFIMLSIFALAILSLPFTDWDVVTQKRAIAMIVFSSAAFIGIAIFWFGLFRYEFRRFTHYPMRFNRKNRKVYVTRLDGTVMIESWDKLFFEVVPLHKGTDLSDIRGHRLAEDGRTVLETFALAFYGEKRNKNMYCQWEFIRRYMEEGPQAFMDDIEIIMDVADRRETFWNGYSRLAAEDGARGGIEEIIFFPVNFWYSLGRWVAMQSSKIPVWPPEVEAECQIDPDDPYIRDRDNLAMQRINGARPRI
jgi:hypothetical protein